MTPVADSLVQTDAARRALGALRDATGETDGVMERHCVRNFLLCEKLAAEHSAELDREVVLCAEVETMRLADRIEVSGGLFRSGLTRDQLREVSAAAPRDGFYGGLVHAVWPGLRSRPLTLPRIFKP